MRKLIYTIILSLIYTCSIAQGWVNTGNALQRRIISSDTAYRFALGSPGFFYPITSAQVVVLTQNKALKDSAFIKGKNLFDIPNASAARLNLGITPLLALKANDNAVLHSTGTETATGVKSFNPTFTVTGNGQSFAAFNITPTVVNTGGFTAPNVNVNVSANILAQSYRGIDGTQIGSATGNVTTLGISNRVMIKTLPAGAPVVTLFDGGSSTTLGSTTIRSNHSGSYVNISDYGKVIIGGIGNAIGFANATAVYGTDIFQILQPQHNLDTLVALRVNPNFGTGNGIGSYDTLVPGSGYTNGSYTNITCINGTGDFARASLTISGGSVTSLTITSGGAGYQVGDIVNFNNATIGIGGGLSASFRIASLVQYTGAIKRAIKSPSTEESEFAGDIEITTIGKGIILKSPDGTRYRITVANGGTLTTTAL